MGSTGADRSLSSGLIPQWMKNKIDARMDLDENAFSPPSLDDSFFYIRYKRDEDTTPKNSNTIKLSEDRRGSTIGIRPITQILKEENLLPIDKKVPKLNKHTVPCQQYLAQTTGAVKSDIPKTKQSTPGATVRVKSAGTDDGFKGEAAACGTSIIHVANQMVSGKSLRGLPSFEASPCPANNVHSDDSPPDGFDPFTRRGSKSLPTTPNSSPKSRRKLHNRYFTGAFVDNVERYQGSWILSGLLGTREVLSRSATTICEEEVVAGSTNSISSRTSSKVDVNNINLEAPEPVTDKNKAQVFRPKPSELREMNFWSPTSM